MNKCPQCGMNLKGNSCPVCGYSSENNKKDSHSFLSKIPKSVFITWCIWTICVILNIPSIVQQIGIAAGIVIYLFGIILYCGIVWIITNIIRQKKEKPIVSNIPRYNNPISSTPTPDKKPSVEKVFDNMDGHSFEYYCADILSKNGFQNVKVTQGSGDQGIDILAEKDGIKYGIQCKCYSSDIGNKAVQEAFAGKTYYGCHVAVVLTNRHFTRSAKQLSETNNVLLWDREKLESFIQNIE